MRRSQKDFLYLIGTLAFSVMCLSDLKNTWKMLLFLLVFAGLNFYNYIRHKRNEEKWDDILDDMYGDEEDEDDRKKKKGRKESKDKFNDYIRSIEEQYEWEDEEDYDDEED